MLQKKKRLDRRAVERVFSIGRFVRSTDLSLKFLVDSDKVELPRVSFIVPKSVSKSAVERNNLRRKGYRAVEKVMTKFPNGFVGVFIFNKKVLDINNEIKNILHKVY